MSSLLLVLKIERWVDNMYGITGLGSGFDCYVMNSDACADRVIALFKDAMEQGYSPYDVEDVVFEQAGVGPADLTDFDRQRVELTVHEIWEMMNSNRGH